VSRGSSGCVQHNKENGLSKEKSNCIVVGIWIDKIDCRIWVDGRKTLSCRSRGQRARRRDYWTTKRRMTLQGPDHRMSALGIAHSAVWRLTWVDSRHSISPTQRPSFRSPQQHLGECLGHRRRQQPVGRKSEAYSAIATHDCLPEHWRSNTRQAWCRTETRVARQGTGSYDDRHARKDAAWTRMN
jgi:hypothetical protein